MKKVRIPPFDLEAEIRKLRSVIFARSLGGLANDTKWKELIESCYSMDWNGPFYRCKCIDSDYVSKLDGEWHAIPYPFMAIEWLDIKFVERIQCGLLPEKIIDHSSEIEEVLLKIGFDFKKGQECFRIFAYAPRVEAGFNE